MCYTVYVRYSLYIYIFVILFLFFLPLNSFAPRCRVTCAKTFNLLKYLYTVLLYDHLKVDYWLRNMFCNLNVDK